jgi:hypothetical protein
MAAFSRTPQAAIIRFILAGAAPADKTQVAVDEVLRSSSPEYISQLTFAPGERVNGVYTVAYAGADRVEWALDAPEWFKGPDTKGRICAWIEKAGSSSAGEGDQEDKVVFINETWLWREVNEPPTMLEGWLGRWMHTLIASWLVVKGIEAVRKK